MALGGAAIMLMIAAFPLARVDAAEPRGAETTASLRAKRQVLVQRIAALTDEVARAEAKADDAGRRRAMSQAAVLEARRRFAAHAVGAYLDGVQDSEDDQLRRRAWADALATPDREVLGAYRAAKERAAKEQAAAEAAITDARQLAAELDAVRARLERTITDRVRWERAAAKASRRIASAGVGSTRHRRATGSQAELMRTYRFGPANGSPPPGLVGTGDVIEGRASWYGPGFDGRPTASGAIFDQEGWTVAHRTLPLGTILLISREGRSVVVLVNDRGPFVGGRILDLSHGVANYLGTVHAGVAHVRAEVLVPV